MRLHPAAVTSVLLSILLVGPNPASSQSSSQTERDVREALRGERDLRELDVTIAGTEVTLSDQLETFWSKSEAIRRALEVDGVEPAAAEFTGVVVGEVVECGDNYHFIFCYILNYFNFMWTANYSIKFIFNCKMSKIRNKFINIFS